MLGQVFVIVRRWGPENCRRFWSGDCQQWTADVNSAVWFSNQKSANAVVLNLEFGEDVVAGVESHQPSLITPRDLPDSCDCCAPASTPKPTPKLCPDPPQKDHLFFVQGGSWDDNWVVAKDFQEAIEKYRRMILEESGDDYMGLEDVPMPDGVTKLCDAEDLLL